MWLVLRKTVEEAATGEAAELSREGRGSFLLKR